MYSVPGDTTSLVPGFPIRTSSDPRSVDSSPRHIAASHVLHRLPVPRHPPCALKHLQHKTKKMSPHPHTPPKGTCEIRKNLHYIPDTHPHQGRTSRCSQPLSTNQTPHPTTKAGRQPKPPPNGESRHLTPARARSAGLLSQSPIVCLTVSITEDPAEAENPCRLNVCFFKLYAPDPSPLQRTGHPQNRPTRGAPHDAGRFGSRGAP